MTIIAGRGLRRSGGAGCKLFFGRAGYDNGVVSDAKVGGQGSPKGRKKQRIFGPVKMGKAKTGCFIAVFRVLSQNFAFLRDNLAVFRIFWVVR